MLTLAVIRLSLDSHSSRGRIKLLESNESYHGRLVNVVGGLEKHIEDAVADLVNDPGHPTSGSSAPGTSPFPSSSPSNSPPDTGTAVDKPQEKKHTKKTREATESPKAQLSDLQRQMVVHLNALPNLKKELAFFDPTTNSHAVIVARDVKRYKYHEQGWGVLRHLADHFII